LNTREYQRSLPDLQESLKDVASAKYLSSLEREERTSGLKNQITALNGQRQIQVAADQNAISDNTISGATTEALNQIVQTWNNLGKQIAQTVTRGVEDLNSNIVKAATGQKTSFGGAFLGVGQGLIRTGLQRAEGSVLSAFGFGGKKADGSAANPFYVKMAGGIHSETGSLGKLFSHGIPGSSSLKGFFGSIGHAFQGFFADGGDVVSSRPAIVGEAGPELFIPHSSGTIVPNHALGGTTHTYHIDARGSTDPSAVEAAVRRAIPSAVSASVQTQHQRSIRTPHKR
jgi:hypothetical protein